MRNVSRIVLTVGTSAVLVGSFALPSSAADTDATVQVAAGSLTITAPAAAAPLTELVPGQSITADIDGVSVTDDRAGIAGWNVEVVVADFVGANTADVIAATAVDYTPGAAVTSGTATVTATPAVGISTPKLVQAATAVNGNNTATWDATLQVTAPADALADTYTAVLTHSVL